MEQQEWAAKLGVGILTLNSGLAIYGSRGDAASVAFVLAAYAALVLLLLLCLRKLERGGGHGGGEGGAAARRIRTSGAYSALAKVGLAMVTCNTALDTYDARRDAVSAALVAASYAALVILTVLFARAFARAQAQAQD